MAAAKATTAGTPAASASAQTSGQRPLPKRRPPPAPTYR
jgi:hypothetical protein